MTSPRFCQAAFTAALLAQDSTLPPGLAAGTPPHRFEVYRRNVQAGLARALAARFPVVQALVGEAFFMAMAREFATHHPPASPVLIEFGHALPDFLRGFAPAASVPYLADVAALETARTDAWHAPELPMADPADLQGDDLAELRLMLQPSLRLVRSPHPVLSIWQRHADSGVAVAWAPQSVAVFRQGRGVVQEAVAPDMAAFLGGLLAGAAIGTAFHLAVGTGPDFDATAAFAWLLTHGLIAGPGLGTDTQAPQNGGPFTRPEPAVAGPGIVA
jgi:hypothetical protein